MIKAIQILFHQGKQFIPDLNNAVLKPPFRGRPVISPAKTDEYALSTVCPMGAILTNPVRLDMGKCNFCGECAVKFPEKIAFTTDYKIASNKRENLIISESETEHVSWDNDSVRSDIKKLFKSSLKLRQVSAGGDNSAEWELNATGNVNFDIGRYGIEFVASPRHADGIVITGPISSNMSEALQICFDAVPSPKMLILCGVDAISGGIFSDGSALNREFLAKHPADLYIPGNPPHPLTIINGILKLTRNI